MKELFYTDETKVKNLTVGQLKDIIIETLNNSAVPSLKGFIFEAGRGYIPTRPVYPDPTIEPYCDNSSLF